MGNCLSHEVKDDFNKTALDVVDKVKHEMLILEGGEADVHKHYSRCKKNPGHKEFIPIHHFTIENLPEDFKDEKLVDYIRATADLTVRVAVKMTSTQRPDFYPNTDQPYASSDIRGSDVLRLGTGMIRWINMYAHKSGKTCPCIKCLQSRSPSKVWGQVRMCTATHVVFDDIEAEHTTCRLFYDQADSPLVTMDDCVMGSADVKSDTCWMNCYVCDVDLLNKLYTMWKRWRNAWCSLNKVYTLNRFRHKFNFIVSHPHGCPKQVSVGRWESREICSTSNGGWEDTEYRYKTCTCPGSSGAVVNTMKPRDVFFMDAHVHKGTKGNLNISSIYPQQSLQNISQYVDAAQLCTRSSLILPTYQST